MAGSSDEEFRATRNRRGASDRWHSRNIRLSVEVRLVGTESRCVLDDFQFSRSVDGAEELIDSGHGRLLQFRVAALGTLKVRQRLQNDDHGVREFERQIRNAGLQESSTCTASHFRDLLTMCVEHRPVEFSAQKKTGEKLVVRICLNDLESGYAIPDKFQRRGA